MLSVVSKTKILNVSNGDIVVPRRLVRVAMFAARGKISGEGIGWFAAKRGEGSDGRSRGIEAEMILAGMRAVASSRFRPTLRVERNDGVLGQNHCSGQPDGAAGGDNVSPRWAVSVCLQRLEASPPKPRRLAQIKKEEM